MTIATLDEVIQWGEDGEIDGLQFDGRQRAIQEWRDRKEEAEYKKLFARLTKRNAQRRRESTTEGREKSRQRVRRHRLNNRERVNRRAQEIRREKYETDPVVNTCRYCGRREAAPFEAKRKRRKYCSKVCANRYHHKRRNRPKKGTRDNTLRRRVLRHLRSNGPATAAEISAEVGGKRNSLHCQLWACVRAGLIVKSGQRPARYLISDR